MGFKEDGRGREVELVSQKLEAIPGKTHQVPRASKNERRVDHLLRRTVYRQALHIPQDFTLTILHRPTLQSPG